MLLAGSLSFVTVAVPAVALDEHFGSGKVVDFISDTASATLETAGTVAMSAVGFVLYAVVDEAYAFEVPSSTDLQDDTDTALENTIEALLELGPLVVGCCVAIKAFRFIMALVV